MLHHLADHLTTRLFSFGAAVVVATWLTTIAGAGVVFLRRHGAGHPLTVRGFLSFLIPRQLWLLPSPRRDVLYYLANYMLLPILAVPFLLSNLAATLAVYRHLTAWFGPHPQVPAALWLWFGLLMALLMVADFSTFLIHYCEHKLGPLWDLHKVHHSSTWLTPLTNKRLHPFEVVLDVCGNALLIGAVSGGASYALGLPPYDSSIMGLDIYFLANFFGFYHLRHSHIDMAYPAWLERWLLSPAQHQLHHSREPQHWDHNFGLCLAVWDRVAGTLLPSQPRTTYQIGLPERERLGYETIAGFYLTPVLRAGARASRVGRPWLIYCLPWRRPQKTTIPRPPAKMVG